MIVLGFCIIATSVVPSVRTAPGPCETDGLGILDRGGGGKLFGTVFNVPPLPPLSINVVTPPNDASPVITDPTVEGRGSMKVCLGELVSGVDGVVLGLTKG